MLNSLPYIHKRQQIQLFFTKKLYKKLHYNTLKSSQIVQKKCHLMLFYSNTVNNMILNSIKYSITYILKSKVRYKKIFQCDVKTGSNVYIKNFP